MFGKTNYNYGCSFVKEYIKLHQIDNVFVTENSLVIHKKDSCSVVTLPKNKNTIIKILNNARD